jgi:plasmid stabilization system protein ParE
MRVLWTEQALRRLVEIEDFVSADDPGAAAKLVTRLVDRGESLARLWQRGRRLPEMPASPLRELVEDNYRIVYRIRKSRIEVLTVFEGHRRLRRSDVS